MTARATPWLADQIESPTLLVGTGELPKFSLVSAQLARRLNQAPFLPYRAVSGDIAAFLGVVLTLLEAMPLRVDFTLDAHRSFFFDGAAGSVGLLKRWFARVVEDAIKSDRHNATLADFERLRMPLGKLTLIANVREGHGRPSVAPRVRGCAGTDRSDDAGIAGARPAPSH